MSETKYDRRAFMAYFSSIGLGSTLFPGVLWGQAQSQQQGPEITKEMIASAEQIAGLSFSDEERTSMVRSLTSQRADIARLHKEPIDMSMPPAIVFDPVPPGKELPKKTKAPMVRAKVPVMARPGSVEELAYSTVAELSELVRTRKVKPSELTNMYIGRLKKYDDKLHFYVNLTEDRAKKQAADADSEIARGKYRGPLHGIPWGAKDLLAVKGTPTTWGAGLYQNQMFDYNATVVNRLDEAGAILIAKLTLGSLAQGDRWWKERTRNPWNPETGASGSSAGPGSATAAGCVGFSIGSETNGSILSPSRTNGITGFRPSFGRVSRAGAMALSWTTDKLGPMCRSAEDCALVFDAIQGPDGLDRSVKAYPFNWDANRKLSTLRIAYIKTGFERRGADGTMTPNVEAQHALDVLRGLGAKLDVLETAPEPNYGYLDNLILDPECGAAFEVDTLNSKIKELESYSSWPNTFRAAQFVPAVDYVNANRVRVAAMNQMWDLFQKYDVVVTTGENGSVTNITGTPSIVVPTGFAIPQGRGFGGGGGGRGGGGGGRGGDTTRPAAPPPPVSTIPLPTSISFMGPIFQDEKNLLVAHAFQTVTDFHKKHPPMFG